MKLPFPNPLDQEGFYRRLVSALTLVVVALTAVILGGIWFALVVMVFVGMMLFEWKTISDPKGGVVAHMINFVALISTMSALLSGDVKLAGILLMMFMLLAGLERARRGSAWRAGFGILYVLLPGLLLLLLRQMQGGLGLVVFIFFVVWSADSGAYLMGSMLKGPKLWPEISPNKTWSGFFGGIAMGTFFGVLIALLFGRNVINHALLAFGLTIVAAGGDLLISRMKRHFGVKDTGAVIPGHGGVLDRMDAFLAAVLVTSAMIYEFPGIWGQF